MEEDSCDHDSCAEIGVADWRLLEGDGCHATSYGLYDERDEVDGAKDVEVHFRGDGGGLATECDDETTEDDIDAGSEEGGCCG